MALGKPALEHLWIEAVQDVLVGGRKLVEQIYPDRRSALGRARQHVQVEADSHQEFFFTAGNITRGVWLEPRVARYRVLKYALAFTLRLPQMTDSFMRRLPLAVVLTFLCCSVTSPRAVGAQASRVTMGDFATGEEFEDYLRVLQIAGMAPHYPWSIRGFSRREIERLVSADTAGPWKLKNRFSAAHVSAGPFTLGATFNSAYPYGANDGPLWAGRGLTVAASGGVSGHLGPFSFSVAPRAFRAANRPFDLLPNGKTGAQAFNHGTYSDLVDLPQRFGSAPYSRLDPGNSFLRFDTRLLAAGISTANEWIGPATEFPFLLGTNAAGFPHLFLRTGEPVNVGFGRLQARVTWGKLDQSDYSPVSGSTRYIAGDQTGTIRLAASAEAVILPRGIPGLELGLARFFHVPYREGEPSANFWRKPFRLFFTKNEFAQGDTAGADNQLASVFFRWVFPHSGFEIYGERGYEDQFYDLREFIENLDHDREYMLGFQKILRARPGGMDVLKAELINYQRSTLALIRGEGFVYVHGTLRQGHTNRGQLLGASPGVESAAASTLSWTRYSPRDRTSVTLRRIVRDQRGDYQVSGIVDPRGSDVVVAAGLERMRFGRVADIGWKVEAMDDLNRNFSRDVANLNLQVTARLHPW